MTIIQTEPHWAAAYIGLPWAADGEGPDAFHCWSLFRHVQQQRFGRTLPVIPNPDDLLALARSLRDHPERRRWVLTRTPHEGDLVLLRQARYPIHVGLWIDGGLVLHCLRAAGVVAQSTTSLAIHGWQIEGIYRFTGDRPCPS